MTKEQIEILRTFYTRLRLTQDREEENKIAYQILAFVEGIITSNPPPNDQK